VTLTLIAGANKGLGRETARLLLGVGHTVLVGARDAERGQRTADELAAVFLEIDPTSDASVGGAAERVWREYGRLDVLIKQRRRPRRRSNGPHILRDGHLNRADETIGVRDASQRATLSIGLDGQPDRTASANRQSGMASRECRFAILAA
jgi:hypothetical protein